MPDQIHYCGEDGCGQFDDSVIYFRHTPRTHCRQDQHCITMDAACNASWQHEDHSKKCCTCGANVIPERVRT